MAAVTAGEGPDNDWAVHDCGYAPLLTGGRLVKKYDPAWQLPEVGNGRDAETLQRFVDARAAHDLLHRRPGYGLGYHHSVDPRCEVSGYPDCHMWTARPGGQMFRELKRMGQAPRPDQAAALTALQATGADVGVWWPCCWYSGRVDRELAALAGAKPIGAHWAPGLPPQPGQAGYAPHRPNQAAAAAVPAQRKSSRNRGRADLLAPRSTPKDRPPVELPGAELPDGFADGRRVVGYVVPMPTMYAAGGHLDQWLRDHGFPPAMVPWPVRVVVAGDGMAVQCRVGGHGAPRVWRWAPLRRTLSDNAMAMLGADIVSGPFVLDLIGEAVSARDLPAT